MNSDFTSYPDVVDGALRLDTTFSVTMFGSGDMMENTSSVMAESKMAARDGQVKKCP